MSRFPENFTPQFNKRVLMSGAEFMSDEFAINPYMDETVPINIDVAVQQHTGIMGALRSIGVEVVKTDAVGVSQDEIFTANEAVGSIDDSVFLMAKLPNVRQPETPHYEQILKELGKQILTLPNPDWYFSGQGDALRYGNYLVAGSGYRTTPQVVHEFIKDNLGYTVLSLQTKPLLDTSGTPVINKITGLPDSEFYDLDYAFAPIKWPTATEPGLVLYCEEAYDEENLAKLLSLPNTEFIKAPYSEATGVSAVNLVSTGQAVVMNAGAPITEAALREKGLYVVTTVNDELKKNGGSVRCTTLTLNHT